MVGLSLQHVLLGYALILVTIATGYVLKRRGRPYGTLLLTAHKVAAIVGAGLLALAWLRAFVPDERSLRVVASAVAAAAAFAVTVASGGILAARNKNTQFGAVHGWMPFLAIALTTRALLLALI